jgi:hypothetical protein
MPTTVATLAQYIKIIGMVIKSPKIGESLGHMAIYRRLSKT